MTTLSSLKKIGVALATTTLLVSSLAFAQDQSITSAPGTLVLGGGAVADMVKPDMADYSVTAQTAGTVPVGLSALVSKVALSEGYASTLVFKNVDFKRSGEALSGALTEQWQLESKAKPTKYRTVRLVMDLSLTKKRSFTDSQGNQCLDLGLKIKRSITKYDGRSDKDAVLDSRIYMKNIPTLRVCMPVTPPASS